MENGDLYPHFDFNSKKIREHWYQHLGNCAEAEEYLRVVERRLEYWLLDCGPWIDFDFAKKHLEADLSREDAESHLVWLALEHRVRIANEQRNPSGSAPMPAETGISVPLSCDGVHDAVWHEDFRDVYKQAIDREIAELRKLKETGRMPANRTAVSQEDSKAKPVERPRIQWMWANRLLPYLFQTLLEREAVCAEDGLWAALDGVFADRTGKPITRKHLALWACQYRNNKACDEESGKPKKHGTIDEIVEEIHG